MHGFKVIAFHPVHTTPFMFVYGFSFEEISSFSKCMRSSHDDNENMAARRQKCTYLPVYMPV